jgi:hypothetical protein
MMRRSLVAALVLLVACAPREQEEPATPSEVTLSDFVGTWVGEVKAEGSDSVLAHVELFATGQADGWSYTVVNAHDPARSSTTPAQVTSIGGDSIVVEAGPFASVLREGQMVSTHAVYRLQNGRLTGTAHTTYPGSGETITLMTEATRR